MWTCCIHKVIVLLKLRLLFCKNEKKQVDLLYSPNIFLLWLFFCIGGTRTFWIKCRLAVFTQLYYFDYFFVRLKNRPAVEMFWSKCGLHQIILLQFRFVQMKKVHSFLCHTISVIVKKLVRIKSENCAVRKSVICLFLWFTYLGTPTTNICKRERYIVYNLPMYKMYIQAIYKQQGGHGTCTTSNWSWNIMVKLLINTCTDEIQYEAHSVSCYK